MYREFFQLREKPFELVPNPTYLYLSRGHRKALSYLEYGIQERAGFTLLTGEVGSGKTTLLRMIIRKLGARQRLAMVFNTRVSAAELLALISEDFGITEAERDKVTLLRGLHDFLVAENSAGNQPIVIIDEAQNLEADALEEIRLLSNLELEQRKLLQIVLVGQPELKEIVSRPQLRQLRQRISISCHLGPLERDETEQYVFHRLETAGNREAVSFAPGALDELHEATGGSPRMLNVFGDFLLLAAFVDERREISFDMVREAMEELDVLRPEPGAAADAGQLPPVVASPEILARFESLERELGELKQERSLADGLTEHDRILGYLVEQQQQHANQLNDSLRKMNYLINRLYRLAEGEGNNGS
ncbi:MAG: AAA family ATPase [Deltaproteobacteria bacterium]|nr:AAA family ATPase [Candidatus Anaeroferrophillacea bacterium]